MASGAEPAEGPHSLAAMRERWGPRYRWYLLFSVMVGTIASILSSTVVNVAIPDMSHHFALGQERAQWISSGFMLAMTCSMLTTPWLLARYGYRAVYIGTMVLLLAGGVTGGLASHFLVVLGARVAEGLAAGVLQPIPAIIVMRAFEPHEQGRASGIFGMGAVLAPAVGPALGGVLVDSLGWRSIFFMVVPFCIASFVLARRFVPASAPGGLAMQRGARLDWLGLLLATAGTLCLLNGLVELHGGAPAAAAALLGGAALCLLLFLGWQHRLGARGGEPLMNLGLFGSRNFALGSIVAFIYGTALFGSTYLLPVYMQFGLQMGATQAGAVLLPAGVVLALTIAFAGRQVYRVPTRVLVSTGLALLAASFALMPTIGLQTASIVLIAWCVLGRIGLGFILPSLNLGAMNMLDKSMIAQGASAINFVRMLGGAAGVSLCGILLEWRIAAHGDSLAHPGSSAARLAAFDESFLVLAAVCALAIVAAWRLRDGSDTLAAARPRPRTGRAGE